VAKTIQNQEVIAEEPTNTLRSFIDYGYHEVESRNLINSGRLWVGEKFQGTSAWDTTFLFENIDPTQNVNVGAGFVARDNATSRFDLQYNQSSIGTTSIGSVDLSSYIYDYARTGQINTSFTPNTDALKLTVRFLPQTFGAEGWLDYLTINAYRKLIYTRGPMVFTNIKDLGPQNHHRFELENGSSDLEIWDVTNIHEVYRMQAGVSGSKLTFIRKGDKIRRFIAFGSDSDFKTPEIEAENIPNQNLHGTPPVDYVIVAYPDFMDQAEELAQLHRDKSGLEVLVVTTEQVYNEFSSGTPDVTAIRDFMRFLYLKHGTEHPHALKYLLLFGDGSYNNKAKPGENSNFILTYQSKSSLVQTASFVADDYLTFLDEGEGDNGGTMDIGVGRLPVSTVIEAQQAVDKIRKYMDAQGMLPWRNKIAFIGDDEDGNIHMDQADQLTRKVDTLHPEFVLQKIYHDNAIRMFPGLEE